MLTERQQEVLDFLKRYQRETGLIPSTREIQEHFGFASQTAAMSHLRALELSEQRASAVVTYLINKGIPIGQLQFKGLGRQQPIAEQNTPTGRMANQRIEVLILD